MDRDLTPLPRLRPGLEIVRTGPRSFILHGDRSRGFLTFGAEERYLLYLFEEGKTEREVLSAYRTRFGHELPRARLLEFLEQLRNLGLVVDGHKAPSPPPTPGTLRDGHSQPPAPAPAPLSSADPKARLNFIFDILTLLLGWILHPVWFVAILPTALVGFIILVKYIGNYFASLRAPSNYFPPLWLLFLVVSQTFVFVNIPRAILFGVAIRRFGGRLTKFSFRFWEGVWPTFYCEHDFASWALMSERGKWTILGFDMWYQLAYGGLVIIAWRMSPHNSGTAVFFAWLSPPVVVGILLHLFVHIKYCVYFMISYVTGETQILERSLEETRAWLNFSRAPEGLTSRQRYWFRVYGISYWIFRTLVECLLFFLLWLWLAGKYKGTGAVIVVAAFVWWYRRPIYNLCFAPIANLFSETQAMQWVARSGGAWWFRWPVRLIVIAGFVLLGMIPYNYELSGECRVIPEYEYGVRAIVPDEITEVNVKEGDHVEPGTVLARLEGREIQMEIATTEASLRKAEANLDMLRSGYLDEELNVARDTVKVREEQAALARTEVKRVDAMVRERAASREELDKKIKTLEVYQEQVISAKENLVKLQQGYREEQVRMAEADVKGLEEKLKYYKHQLTDTELISPIAGRVSLPYMHHRKGQHVNVGDLVCVVQDPSKVLVEVASEDAAALEVKEGMPVHVRLYGMYGRLMTGKVVRVAVTGETSDKFGNGLFRTDPETMTERNLNSRVHSGNYDVRVYVQLDERPPDLATEMYGYARIVIDENDLFWHALARPFVRYLRTEVWAWLP